MTNLNMRDILVALVGLAAFGAGCTNAELKETLPLETDSFISSADAANHSELPNLNLSKSSTLEERIVARLPTKQKDVDKALEEALAEDLLRFFFLPLDIMARIISCADEIMQPQNLTAAELKFDIISDAEGALGGKLKLELLGKPWWQDVSWTRAHPFSKTKGIWSTPGGDVDPSISFAANTLNSTTVVFDIKEYFRYLIQSDGTVPHYGFVIHAVNVSLNPVQLRSTQNSSWSQRPRVEATYTGNCTRQGYGTYRSTTVLGADGAGWTEKIQ